MAMDQDDASFEALFTNERLVVISAKTLYAASFDAIQMLLLPDPCCEMQLREADIQGRQPHPTAAVLRVCLK